MVTFYRAVGKGDLSKCKFQRTVKDFNDETQNGKKVVTRNDKEPQSDLNQRERDDALTTSKDGSWEFVTADFPSILLIGQKLPGSKKADYRFWVKDSNGTTNQKCDKS